MANLLRSLLIVLSVSVTVLPDTYAQNRQKMEDKEAEYTRVVMQRADKIVVALNLPDTGKENRVRDIIVQQYRDLNAIDQSRTVHINTIRQQAGDDKQLAALKISEVESDVESKLKELHDQYIARLSGELDGTQIEKVKDGMTYNVLPITYKGYLEMLPDLTERQKAQILAYLTEAREYAMDAGSSDKKHWWFGKYKGKINNYLSAEGVETKKAREEWEKKLKERQSVNRR